MLIGSLHLNKQIFLWKIVGVELSMMAKGYSLNQGERKMENTDWFLI